LRRNWFSGGGKENGRSRFGSGPCISQSCSYIQDTFHEARGGLVISYSIAMNPNRIISVLTDNVVFIRQVSESTYELSTISITKDDELIHFTFQMKENRPPSS
jgi:hypothetical protein